ncbi:MAG: DUF2283 domain-containing protein [Gemmatimonadales bacterium]
MKVYYYAETDSLYIDLADRPSTASREVLPGVVLDLDAAGHLVGIDIDHASRQLDLPAIDASQVPFEALPRPA